ncbi:MAG: PmoA family protein [Planctomycetes bacterium]|nr:PmoA family protein [Planctomycetota bacterium]
MTKSLCRWMDYSGPIAVGEGPDRKSTVEGVTYFDHLSNPRFPSYWHVREDGWMGASFGMHEPFTIHRDKPLVLRYLLYAHAGGDNPLKRRKSARRVRGTAEIQGDQKDQSPWPIRRGTEWADG